MIRLPRIAMCIAIASTWALLALPQAFAFDNPPPIVAAQGSLQAAFAPWDDIEDLITHAINGATKQVLVQAYLLTDKKLAATLIAAQRRGIDVNVLADALQFAKMESSKIPELAAAGIPVWLETKYQNAHNKIIVIDAAAPDATVITGSFNFTWSAQHVNAENILIARNSPILAARYAANWERHRQQATLYKK
jgi:phosphatidylserine/phosphatidylglycerophosphate/cardiolipin synthase-like enzyme